MASDMAGPEGSWWNLFDQPAVGQLCVHNKQIEEVERWLLNAFSSLEQERRQNPERKTKGGRILVISGPCGSGKSVVLYALAKRHGWDIQAFDNEETSAIEHFKNLVYQNYWLENQILLFETWPSLFNHSKRAEIHDFLINKYFKSGASRAVMVFIHSYTYSRYNIYSVETGTNNQDDDFKYLIPNFIKSKDDKYTEIRFSRVSNQMIERAMRYVKDRIQEKYPNYFLGFPHEIMWIFYEYAASRGDGDIKSALTHFKWVWEANLDALKIAKDKPQHDIRQIVKELLKNMPQESNKGTHLWGTLRTIFHGTRNTGAKPEDILSNLPSSPSAVCHFLGQQYSQYYSNDPTPEEDKDLLRGLQAMLSANSLRERIPTEKRAFIEPFQAEIAIRGWMLRQSPAPPDPQQWNQGHKRKRSQNTED